MSMLRIYGLVADTIVDGPGLRFGVFVQGCTHGCPGCHNPESHSFDGGSLMSIDEVIAQIHAAQLDKGVTISGGEPFDQPAACAELAERLREEGYDVWVYSGYRLEDLMARTGEAGEHSRALLRAAQVLVDGPFVQERKSYLLHWCGSSNQRVIDLRQTWETGDVVLYQNVESFPEKPEAW